MDIDDETKKLKSGLVILLLFVCSTFVAYGELKYLLGAETAEATIERIFETRGRRGSVTRNVEYRFQDSAGQRRKHSDSVADDWFPPGDGTLSIEYLSDRSRLAGHRNYFGLGLFFVSLVALAVGGYMFWQHVREATRPTSGARR